jgi:hypothetical protein
MQRRQNAGACRSHRNEWRVGLGIAGVALNGIPAVNDTTVFDEQSIGARVSAILKTNTRDPSPSVERVDPMERRNLECIVRVIFLESVLEVLDNKLLVGRLKTQASLRLARPIHCMPATAQTAVKARTWSKGEATGGTLPRFGVAL